MTTMAIMAKFDQGLRTMGTLYMGTAAESPLRFACVCFPPASPTFVLGAGKQKAVPKDRSKQLICPKKIGAGEGIRTLDPDLGKILVHPR